LRLRTLFVLGLSLLAGSALAGEWLRVRVTVPNEPSLQRLLDSDLTLYSCCPTLGETDVALAEGDQPKLWALGLRYRVVGKIADPTDVGHGHGTAATDYRAEYFNMNEILGFFEGLRTQYPTTVSRQQIGVSRQGEAIWAYRIGRPVRTSGTPENNLVVLGIQHAREWVSGSVVMHIGKRATEEFANVFIRSSPYLPNRALWIVPVTNPDGYRYTWSTNRLWRKNRRNNGNGTFGVDLNRNWATGWGGSGSSGSTSSDIYRGPSAFSEPETQAVRNLAQSLPRIGGMIDFHSYSQLVLWSWGYTTSAPPDAALLTSVGGDVRTAMSAFGATYDAGQASTALYLASGVAPDWFYDVRRVPTYTVELRDTGQYGFELPPAQIRPTQDEAWAGFNALANRTSP
jgi:hypothetical protein